MCKIMLVGVFISGLVIAFLIVEGYWNLLAIWIGCPLIIVALCWATGAFRRRRKRSLTT